MDILRKILFPFSILYGLIASFRNFLFDKGILKSYSFSLPVIAVGNLSVGGTGKTPQIEYLVRLLSPKYKVATLSRGYKRKSEGFILADAGSSASVLGDEPFQFYKKFPDIMVAVDADRKNGIEQLMKISRPDIILLDDAFQHRRVRAGFYILLTAYNDLYADDYMLPAGNLRESRSGAKRANVVIVTKCPSDLFEKEKNRIERKLRLKPGQLLFFTSIAYDEFIYSEEEQLPVESIRNTAKVILAGIAKPAPFFGYLKNDDDTVLAFPDHHHFTDKDIEAIKDKAGDRIIIATEKDYVRLKGRLPEAQLFYLPIRSLFLGNAPQFDEMITAYVNNIIK